MSASMTTPHLPGKFVWFEHVSADLGAARAFYEPLFGWHVEGMPLGDQNYRMLLNRGEGIGGFLEGPAGTPAHWVSYLSVLDVDRAYAAATAAGAVPRQAPVDVPPVGRGASLIDPCGAPLSLWTSARGDRPDAASTSVGDWHWNELWTSDARRALDFYSKAFGLAVEPMQFAGQGQYVLLKSADGRARAGVYEAPDGHVTPRWLPYVHVADCDAIAARATQLGATSFLPPNDIEGVGRVSALVDPLGAAIAIIQPSTP